VAIRDWPEAERPREKLLAQGAVALSDAELLAIFLRTGHRGKSAVELARDLVLHFKGLRGLLESNRKSFCGMRGLGVAKFCMLQAALEMSRRHMYEGLQAAPLLSSVFELKRYLRAKMRHLQHEVFACIHLDCHHHMLHFEELFRGTVSGASVYPREVIKSALAHNAAAVILVHNHPSGRAEPSQADHRITKSLKQALKLVDIDVLDHLIVADDQVLSFVEKGFI